MKKSIHTQLYVAEVASTFIMSLGVMLLIVVSAAGIFLTLTEDDESSVSLGSASAPLVATADTSNKIVVASQGEGQVAGVVDDASTEERIQQNEAASWYVSVLQEADLLEVRTPYRDSVLDRSAQNYARSVADTCNLDSFTDWSDQIGVRIDEGFIDRYSETAFLINDSSSLSTVLPAQSNAYQKLFLDYEAFGVGLAKIPAGVSCSNSNAKAVLTFHLATYN